MERFAVKAGLDADKGREIVFETLEELRRVWRDLEPELPLPTDHKAALREHWKAIPLLREAGSLE